MVDYTARNADVVRMFAEGYPVYLIGKKHGMTDCAVYKVAETARKNGAKFKRPYMPNRTQRSCAKIRKERAERIRNAAAEKGIVTTNLYISVSNAARLCDCTIGTIYGAIYHKKLKASRPRGRWMVTVPDLLEWCES